MIFALALTTAGIILNAFTALVLAQTNPSSGTDIAAYISGGGSAAAVGGLVYVVRKVFSGDLISRPTSVVEQELVRLVNESHNRESELQKVMGLGFERERKSEKQIERSIEALARISDR